MNRDLSLELEYIVKYQTSAFSTTCFEKHDEWNLNGITRFIFKSNPLFLHNNLFINPDFSFLRSKITTAFFRDQISFSKAKGKGIFRSTLRFFCFDDMPSFIK